MFLLKIIRQRMYRACLLQGMRVPTRNQSLTGKSIHLFMLQNNNHEPKYAIFNLKFVYIQVDDEHLDLSCACMC